MIELIKKFADVKVLVLGDVMLDQYLWGNVSRISPEAPVPIVNVYKKSSVLGGAANVAANIKSLGASPYLIGICGKDKEAENMELLLAESDISNKLFKFENRLTTVKTRIIAHQQHVARIDQETKDYISDDESAMIYKKLSDLIDKITILVVSDYAKGFLTDNFLSRLITTCKEKNKIVLVDPKGKNFNKYKGATILTPNRKESAEASGFDENDSDLIAKAGKKLLDEAELNSILITQGENGMTLLQKDGKTFYLEAQTRKVYDVTGAGDTVIATFAVAVGAGASFFEAAQLANTAAGLVVREVGTTSISLNKLRQEF